MPRISTAKACNYVCPLCGQELKRNDGGRGYVGHKSQPNGSEIFEDSAKIRRMLASGDLSPNYLDYYKKTGHCPFQQGQKDEPASTSKPLSTPAPSTLEPKAPEIIQNILWIWRHGWRNWLVLALASAFVITTLIVTQLDSLLMLFGRRDANIEHSPRLEARDTKPPAKADPAPEQKQDHSRITGWVYGHNREPLEGAEVKALYQSLHVKGYPVRQISTVTDKQGKFILFLPKKYYFSIRAEYKPKADLGDEEIGFDEIESKKYDYDENIIFGPQPFSEPEVLGPA